TSFFAWAGAGEGAPAAAPIARATTTLTHVPRRMLRSFRIGTSAAPGLSRRHRSGWTRRGPARPAGSWRRAREAAAIARPAPRRPLPGRGRRIARPEGTPAGGGAPLAARAAAAATRCSVTGAGAALDPRRAHGETRGGPRGPPAARASFLCERLISVPIGRRRG